LLLLHLLDLLTLLFDLLLLLFDLALRLLILGVLVLHLVANRKTTGCAQAAADCRSCCRMSYGRADNGASTSADQSAHAGTLFAFTQGLSGASGDQEQSAQGKCDGRVPTFAHKIYLLS
jgi:hypothetical protein